MLSYLSKEEIADSSVGNWERLGDDGDEELGAAEIVDVQGQ